MMASGHPRALVASPRPKGGRSEPPPAPAPAGRHPVSEETPDEAELMAALTALLARRQTGQGKGTPPPPSPPGKLLVTVPEVCQMLSIGRSLAYALIAQGIIPSVRLGERRVLVPVAALQEAIMILVQPSR